jgi:Holliday junction DNA helicase RuvA
VYDYLRGRVASRTPTKVVLDVAGVGYELIVPLAAPFADSGEVQVFTHLAVREDAHLLYGFPDRETRSLFRLLLKVKKVGPTVAIALLSGLRPEELVAAIVQGDVARLTRVKGVGRKTAEQILLDLSDQLDQLAPELTLAPGAPAKTPAAANRDDAVAALVSIGYGEAEAARAVEAALAKVGPTDVQSLIRSALGP